MGFAQYASKGVKIHMYEFGKHSAYSDFMRPGLR